MGGKTPVATWREWGKQNWNTWLVSAFFAASCSEDFIFKKIKARKRLSLNLAIASSG